MKDADTYREAMRVIQQCGQDRDPKEYAFGRSSELYEKGDMDEAERWAEIANAIDLLLHDIAERMHIPVMLH